MRNCWAEGWTVHQLTVGAVRGDAITDQALSLRQWLREAGAMSDIYAERIHPGLDGDVLPYQTLQFEPAKRQRLIFHFSLGSPLSAVVRHLPPPIVMMYHNITPAKFFDGSDAELAQQAERGRWELGSFAGVVLALANSEYSRKELTEAGYPDTGILPLAVDEARFALDPDWDLVRRYDDGRTNLLFVGRISPNKRQDDLIKTFAYYKRIDPLARLLLVGGVTVPEYQQWLERLAATLGLNDVIFTNHVSDAEMAAYYRLAHAFVCLSEHEGLGVPLIEAMYSGVPVVAYPAAAVPDTLGEAGVLVHEKNYPLIAEVVRTVVHNEPFRKQLAAAGKARAAQFAPEVIKRTFQAHLAPLLRE